VARFAPPQKLITAVNSIKPTQVGEDFNETAASKLKILSSATQLMAEETSGDPGWQESVNGPRSTEMSETSVGNSESQNSGLYDDTGRPLSKGHEQGQAGGEALVRFSREQPLMTALGALILGYILGRLL
jgi:hypothetical protein